MSKRVRAKRKSLKIGDIATMWSKGGVLEFEILDKDHALNEFLVNSTRPSDLRTFWVEADRLRKKNG